MRQVIILVLDGVGVGAAPDAHKFGDEGSNTLGHILERMPELQLPHLRQLGLTALVGETGHRPLGAYGKMEELSAAKDTTTGHWELMGLVTEKPWPVYPQGFPPEIIDEFTERIGRGILGNKVASGTEILVELGAEHLRTGYPIVYTSVDSVFQIAAHEEVIPVEELYQICLTAREILQGEHGVARVIARPFLGKDGSWTRTARRKDFSLPPPQPTLLDVAQEAGVPTTAIGKIDDIFAHRGIGRSIHVLEHRECIDATLEAMSAKEGIVLTNLVEFDMLYGHRNDVEGFGRALEALDGRIPELLKATGEEQLLVFTADHGCDPTYPTTDHTREYVPLLCWNPRIQPVDLGIRRGFWDLAATVSQLLGLPAVGEGISFGNEMGLD
ncbi:MAG: phosphopentomutase [Limnochordia bacterium]